MVVFPPSTVTVSRTVVVIVVVVVSGSVLVAVVEVLNGALVVVDWDPMAVMAEVAGVMVVVLPWLAVEVDVLVTAVELEDAEVELLLAEAAEELDDESVALAVPVAEAGDEDAVVVVAAVLVTERHFRPLRRKAAGSNYARMHQIRRLELSSSRRSGHAGYGDWFLHEEIQQHLLVPRQERVCPCLRPRGQEDRVCDESHFEDLEVRPTPNFALGKWLVRGEA